MIKKEVDLYNIEIDKSKKYFRYKKQLIRGITIIIFLSVGYFGLDKAKNLVAAIQIEIKANANNQNLEVNNIPNDEKNSSKDNDIIQENDNGEEKIEEELIKYTIDEVEGIWRFVKQWGEEIIIEITKENYFNIYFDNGKSLKSSFSIIESGEDYINIQNENEENIRIVKVNDENIEVDFEKYIVIGENDEKLVFSESTLSNGYKVSKEELEEFTKLKEPIEDVEEGSSNNVTDTDNQEEIDGNLENEEIVDEEIVDEEIVDEENKTQIDDEVVEAITELIEEYEYHYVQAVNYGNPEIVNEYLVYNGQLYQEHSRNIIYFYEEGISETLYGVNIQKIELVNENEYKVEVHEEIGIEIDGNEEVKKFHSTYIVVGDVNNLLISEMLSTYTIENSESNDY